MLKKALHKLRFFDAYLEDNIQLDNVDSFKWDQQADLVVAGFGGAGAAAALEASEQGLTTIVLDRLSGGGATTVSGGVYYAGGGTDIQKACDIDDSADNMFNYLQQEVKGTVSDETLRKFCDDSLENYNWIVNYGVKFDASPCPFKVSFPPDQYFFYYSGNESFAPYTDKARPAMRGHRGHKKGFSGPAIFEPLRKSVLAKDNIDVQYQTRVVSLITDTNENVVGLKAIQLGDGMFSRFFHKLLDKASTGLRNMALYFPTIFTFFSMLTESIERNFGKSVYIRANKGVVLATGGFFSNQNMVKKYAPNFVGGSPLGTLGDDGTGIQMAINLGAKTECMDSIAAWRFINPPTNFVKGMMVGPSGKRVCNEMLYGAQLGDQIMRHHDGKAYIILDNETYKTASKDLTLDKAQWFHIFLGYLFMWFGCKKAQSVRALALQLGIDPQAVHNSFVEYNAIANSDKPDPMGKPKEFMPPLGEGPYYAIDASYDYFYAPCPSLTFGGLKADEQSGRVVNEKNMEINGLYAAGRTAAGIPSRGYVSGLSIADCIFTGRRAARHAAAKP